MSKNQAARQYMIRFGIAMTAYVFVLLISLNILKYVQLPFFRFIVALLPVIPVSFGLVAFIAFLRQMDELERKINFEAFGISMATTGILTFSLGFLETAGFPSLNMLWVFPMLIFFWGLSAAIIRRRYE